MARQSCKNGHISRGFFLARARQTYILVQARCARDADVGAVADIKAIGVVATSAITSSVVDVSTGNGQSGRAVNAEDLDWRVLDVDVVDGRFAEKFVGVEELGLGLAAVRAFAVPPAASVAIEDSATGTSHGDVGS